MPKALGWPRQCRGRYRTAQPRPFLAGLSPAAPGLHFEPQVTFLAKLIFARKSNNYFKKWLRPSDLGFLHFLVLPAHHSTGFPYRNFGSAQAQRNHLLPSLAWVPPVICYNRFWFFKIIKLLCNLRIQQTLKKGKTYFAASLRSVTFLVFPLPSLNVVWFATVNTPFFVEKSGKHLFRTIQNIKTKPAYYISCQALLLSCVFCSIFK